MTGRDWWPSTGRRGGQSGAAETFGALGLPADPALTDDEVRMAWRRIAAATHPDRADGGAPAAFAAAAAAYNLLRTSTGRGEVLADAAAPLTGPAPHPRARRWALTWPTGLAWRVRHGRPWRLAARAAASLALCAAVLAVTGSRPAGPALVTGVLTWFVLTARGDLAPGPAEQNRTDPAEPT
ncbi:MAG TPA: hypothetical protein VNH17_07415 [Streptosporangiaceae bacterium]|nr:hypothetical protein [Streptosporangiaceae bacterium]